MNKNELMLTVEGILMSSQDVRPDDGGHLSFARCRELAREAKSGACAREASRVFRPDTGVSPFRTRAPIAIALYVADRDNLFVHDPAIGFVVLRPHGVAHRRTWQDGFVRGVLRLTDRHWDGVAMLGPAAGFLVIAALLVGVTLLVGNLAAVLWAGLIAGMSAIAWVAVFMGAGLLAALLRALRPRRSGLDQFAADTLPNTTWTAALTHVRDPGRARDLVNLAVTTVRRYVRMVSRERAADVEGRVQKLESMAALAILRRAITTQAGRDAIANSMEEHLFGPAAEVFLVESPDRGANRIPPVPSANFFLLFAFACALVLAFCAGVVARAERAACEATSCEGRPASYGEAVQFLAQRLWFTDPPNIVPATVEGVVFGWLFSLLALTGVGVAVVSVVLLWRKRAMLRKQLDDRRRGMVSAPDLVILTAIEAEHKAVVEHLSYVKECSINGSVFDVGTYFGKHYVWTVAVAQVGSTGERAAVHAERACTAFRSSLSHIMFVGVAGGRKDVTHGDVVMADAVYDYQAGKEYADGLRPRFKTHHSSHDLVQRAQAVARRGQWQHGIRPSAPPPPLPKALIKPIAAGARVIANDQAQTALIIAEHCGDAVAVETMSFGFLYGTYVNATVSAAVVCGVSDLLSDKNEENDDRWQPIAARNAAAFAFAMIGETHLH